jgi:hypothetical protein
MDRSFTASPDNNASPNFSLNENSPIGLKERANLKIHKNNSELLEDNVTPI